MKRKLAQASLQTALKLLLFALVGTGILAFVFDQTRARITQSEEAAKLKLITQIVPHEKFDNDLIRDTLLVPANAQLGTEQVTTAYRARLHGKPSMIVLEAVAPDGYSGKIRLIIAIDEHAVISGVRVVQHKETPGLGDYIDIAKDNWIQLFGGAAHSRYKEEDWAVKKDGGQFDYMAGATITPRALIKAVHKALHYYQENQHILFVKNAASASPQGDKK